MAHQIDRAASQDSGRVAGLNKQPVLMADAAVGLTQGAADTVDGPQIN